MSRLLYLVGVSLVALTTATTTPYSICKWQEPRGAVVRDTWYIEGGIQGIQQPAGTCNSRLNHYGSLFTLNFSTPFNTATSNVTNLFVPVNETIDPSSVTYVNGFIAADNYEWYSFGGQAYPLASQYTLNSGILRNALYTRTDNSAAGLGFTPNYQGTRGNATTKYITNGAGVSIPSESLGFYFSGMRAPGVNGSTNQNISFNAQAYNSPSVLVTSMLKVDISLFGDAEWDAIPLPDDTMARAEASMVWLPIGSKGILVIIGGVTRAADLPGNSGCFMTPQNQTIVNSTAPLFMTNVTVYDVASGRWYSQQTRGTAPPQTAQACAIAATAQDNSTHNIYLYGGYNGVDGSGAYDDVWILSVPSFTWVKASSGNSNHARSGHVCAKPYPDQMMIVGGATQCSNAIGSSAIDVFNLTTLQWIGAYDPDVWSHYSVPSVVTDAIRASPTAASMDSGLLSLFQTPYPSPIPIWYPYGRSPDPNVTPSSPSPSPSGSHTAAIAGGVVGGLAGLGLLVAAFFFFWRRHQKKKTASTATPSANTDVSSWIRGQNEQSTSGQRSDDEMTQVSGGQGLIYEADGTYFKPAPRASVAELHSNQSESNSTQHSAMGSPRGGPNRSPPSSSAELPSETRFELPAEPIVGFVPLSSPPALRNHHLYPASVDGHMSSVRSPSSVSSPSTNPISDDDIPSSASRTGSNEGLSVPDNDMILGHSNSRRSAGYSQNNKYYTRLSSNADPRSPLDKLSPLDEDHRFSTARSDVSPALSPDRENAPRTPPAQSIGARSGAHDQNQHRRNNSSLDSGLATLPSVGSHEEQRQSTTLARLPNTPERPGNNTTNNTGQIATASAMPVRRMSPQDITSWSRPKQSANEENDDMYGDGSGKRS